MISPLVAHVGHGTYEPLQLLPPLGIALAYGVRARTLERRGTPVPRWRVLCFAAGVSLVLLALASPIGHISEELLLAHMAEHLLIGDLATLLIVIGLTGPVLAPLLQVRAIAPLRALANPLVAFPLWALDLYLWHLPSPYQAALHSAFFSVGILMWMPLFGPLPRPAWFGNGARLGYIVAVRGAGAVLGNVFMWSGSVLYPDYRPGDAFWHVSPLTDQGVAGALMMAESSLVTLGLFAWLFFRAASEGEERQRLMELADAQGVDLDEARAARAVAAGRGAQLAERLADK